MKALYLLMIWYGGNAMRLVYKQLWKQIVKDKIFLWLLMLLTMLTSLSFFFAIFSIDGNMQALNTVNKLTENQLLYQNALNSNSVLAYSFLVSLIGLSALVFIMFFYRFFRTNKKQIGCIKALGYKDNPLQGFFVGFTAILSICGAFLGLLGGYFLSDILINANMKTYAVTGLIKGIKGTNLIMGLTAPAAIFCLIAALCYGFVRNKETGFLIAGNSGQDGFSNTLKIADRISRFVPANKRFPLRIALRKPLAVLLLITAVMSFSVCVILGQSLNISSAKIFEMQTIGHNYNFDIRYSEYQTATLPSDTMTYLDSPANVFIDSYELDRTAIGLYDVNEIYELTNEAGKTLSVPVENRAYINPEFSEIYGIEIGDILCVDISGNRQDFVVEDIAVNANSKCFYLNGQQLSEILGIQAGAYSGVFSLDEMQGDDIITKSQRIEDLKRNATSNQVSGVINQSVGVVIGAVLIFLALYINFQDNTHDILILTMMGHGIKTIRKMLVDVYLPILWAAFFITLVPSILLAKSIQQSLSISTNDYMPFGINVIFIILSFLAISLIYCCVQLVFSLGIKNLMTQKELTEIVYSE